VRKETRAKAKVAFEKLAEVYSLLDELKKELSNREDFAGYLMVNDVQEAFRSAEALIRLQAVATMGEKEKP
jgi:hypothetical protein